MDLSFHLLYWEDAKAMISDDEQVKSGTLQNAQISWSVYFTYRHLVS